MEGKLEFDFSGATAADKPEAKANPLKCVDFRTQYPGVLWLIEVKDHDYIPPGRSLQNVVAYGQKIRGGDIVKEEPLPKLYGTFAYLADIENEPRGEVRYGVIIGMAE